jgi:hypothetical protein
MASYEEVLVVKEAQEAKSSNSSSSKNPPRRGGIRTLPFILGQSSLSFYFFLKY